MGGTTARLFHCSGSCPAWIAWVAKWGYVCVLLPSFSIDGLFCRFLAGEDITGNNGKDTNQLTFYRNEMAMSIPLRMSDSSVRTSHAHYPVVRDY